MSLHEARKRALRNFLFVFDGVDPVVHKRAQNRRVPTFPDLVFPTQSGREFYNNALSKLLSALDIACVPHGFRTSFSEWCGHTEAHPDTRERCLAHVVGDDVVEAYFRTDVFFRRVELMESWAQFVMRVDES